LGRDDRHLLKSVYLMTRAVLPSMLRQRAGRIVQISSVAGKYGYAHRAAYCAAKWGLQGFTEALRAEVGPAGIRAHVINPAAVATDWWATTDDPQPPGVLERMMRPEDVAQAWVWVLIQPDHLHIADVVIENSRSRWQ
jgi:NADP-dependent 3-hydroxy acid dehydrogenase YdfG